MATTQTNTKKMVKKPMGVNAAQPRMLPQQIQQIQATNRPKLPGHMPIAQSTYNMNPKNPRLPARPQMPGQMNTGKPNYRPQPREAGAGNTSLQQMAMKDSMIAQQAMEAPEANANGQMDPLQRKRLLAGLTGMFAGGRAQKGGM